eukprot:Skav229422  [mRNA]  locus=scaffold2297:206307:208079:+ [translate_table: standard]
MSSPMASMDAAGYREVVRSQSQEQMVAFLRRMVQQFQLEVPSEESLQTLARQHLKVSRSPSQAGHAPEELLQELRAAVPALASAGAMDDPPL